MEKVPHQDILPFLLHFLIFFFFLFVKPKNPNTDFSSLGNGNPDIFVPKNSEICVWVV